MFSESERKETGDRGSDRPTAHTARKWFARGQRERAELGTEARAGLWYTTPQLPVNMASAHQTAQQRVPPSLPASLHPVQDTSSSCPHSPDIIESVEGGRYARSISQLVEGSCTSPGVKSYNSSYSYDNSAYTYTSECTDLESQSGHTHLHQYSSHPPICPVRRWMSTMAVLVLICLTCTIVSLTLVLAGPVHRRDLGSGDAEFLHSDILCQPCLDLVLSDDPTDDRTDQFDKKLDESGIELCCARNRTQFNALMEVIAQREVRQREVIGSSARRGLPQPSKLNGSVPANQEMAHVYLDTQPGSFLSRTECHQENDFVTLKDWSGSGAAGFVRHGIVLDVERGRFRISRNGIYLLYLRLVYHGVRHHSPSVGSSEEDHFEFRTFSHRVKRQDTNIPNARSETLLEDTRTAFCDVERSGVACHVSMEVAQVKLRRGQEVFIEVNQCTLLKADRKSSYFGLYRLSS